MPSPRFGIDGEESDVGLLLGHGVDRLAGGVEHDQLQRDARAGPRNPRARSTETPLASPLAGSAAARIGLPVLMEARSRPVGAKARTTSGDEAHGVASPDGLAQDRRHHAALAQQLHLELRLDRGAGAERLRLAARANDVHRHRPRRRHLLRRRLDVDAIAGTQRQPLRSQAGRKPQRQDAHADQVRAVDALEARRQHRADAQQALALGRPVARRAGAVALAGDQHDRRRRPRDSAAPPPRSAAPRRWARAACAPPARPARAGSRSDLLWKAARSITSQLPRREANTFRSLRSSPRSTRKSATRLSGGIALAGEMWSVVMSSPSDQQRIGGVAAELAAFARPRRTAAGAGRSSAGPTGSAACPAPRAHATAGCGSRAAKSRAIVVRRRR